MVSYTNIWYLVGGNIAVEGSNYVTLKQGDKLICDKFKAADLSRMENKMWWASIIGLLASAAIIFVVVVPNYRLTYTSSGSMVPTISVGDIVLYGPINNRDDIERGDIILYEPLNPAPDEQSILNGLSGVYYEKRVIGMPGERIRIEDGIVYINGDCLEEPYKVLSMDKNISRDMDEICIPDGCYFVMGDNRDNSADSRVTGPVPYEDIHFSAIIVMPSLAGFLTGVNNDALFIG